MGSEAEDYIEHSVRQSEEEREQRHGKGEAHGQSYTPSDR